VTNPALFTLATNGLVLVHVPPVEGDRVVIEPMHIGLLPVRLMTGLALTVIAAVGLEAQPVDDWVNIKPEVPAEIPVTKPELLTEAIWGCVLNQLPLTVGDTIVVEPSQIVTGPIMLTVGLPLTVTGIVAEDTHPEALSVYVNVANPTETPVTSPLFKIVATDALLLTQTPPDDGRNEVVVPKHIEAGPLSVMAGAPLTFICNGVVDGHPFIAVKIKVAKPLETPVTMPLLVTVATVGLLLIQLPPVVGESVEIAPTQITVGPVKLTTGGVFTKTDMVEFDIQPVEVSVK